MDDTETVLTQGFFPVGDRLSRKECEALELPSAGNLFLKRWVRVRRTGEVRRPKKGEWYISGAVPEGYRAPNDLITEYDIGELVKVECIVSLRVVRVLRESALRVEEGEGKWVT